MLNVRPLASVVLTTTLWLACFAGPVVAGGEHPEATPTATLDGRPIPLADVSKYFCDDFDFPTITCSSSRLIAETRGALVWLLTSVEYVTIYDNTFFSGSFMNVSQDYTILATIGWNDRISSFKARNSETGRFYTDWFMSGTSYSFCCNSQVSSLGSFDNTFSSVERT